MLLLSVILQSIFLFFHVIEGLVVLINVVLELFNILGHILKFQIAITGHMMEEKISKD